MCIWKQSENLDIWWREMPVSFLGRLKDRTTMECKIFLISVLPPVLSCLCQSPNFNIGALMCISLYHGRWLRSCFFLVPFVQMSLHASDIILSPWEEQMGWFILDNNNSLCFTLSPMKFLLKMLSWSNKPGARWIYHLNCMISHQNKFWQILECAIFRGN